MPQTDDSIPAIVKLCIHAIEQKGGLDSEGIYRVSGVKSEVERLRVVRESSPLSCAQTSIHRSSLLSILLLEGPTSLMTSNGTM